MNNLIDEIEVGRSKVEKAYVDVISKCAKVERTDIQIKDDIINFLTEYSYDIKKSSDEYRYCIKLLKAFDEMNGESILFFVNSNYDRLEDITRIIMKYDDNFDDEELIKCQSKFRVLEDLMIHIIESGI